jgi:SAM-dependent methyltransferase
VVERYQPPGAGYEVQVRVRGKHSFRLDGMADLLGRARGRSVFDIGCNRGNAALDLYLHGAALIHGCDIDEEAVQTARHTYADFRDCESRFEVADLTSGPKALAAFGDQKYDITLCLATYHKLKRVMAAGPLSELMQHFGDRTQGFFAWRGTSDKADENDAEMSQLDKDLGRSGLARIHTSYISAELGVAAIWARG